MDALRVMTSGGGNVEEIERLLSCPICLEVYSKPVVILPCQHNLCRKCANDVFQNRGTPMGSGGRFRCPTCRYEVVLDRHGVYGLQRNLLVENIIDMYQSETRKPKFKKAETLMCDEHEEERVNIYCLTCQKPTCSLCKVFGQHQECDVSPMDKVYKDQKRELSDSIAVLVAGNDRLQAIISQTEEIGKITEVNGRKSKSDLCEAFDKLYAVLEDRKNNMMAKITSDVQERNQVLQEMLKTYGQQLECASKLMEVSLGLLEERSIPQFLGLARDTINKISEAAQASDVRKPMFSIQNMDEFKVNFEGQEGTLRRLDFPNFPEDKSHDEDEPCSSGQSQKANDTGAENLASESEDDDDMTHERGEVVDSDDTPGTSVTSRSDLGSVDDRRPSVDGSVRSTSPTISTRDDGDRRNINQEMPTIKRGRWYDLYVRQLPRPQYTYDDGGDVPSLLLSPPNAAVKYNNDEPKLRIPDGNYQLQSDTSEDDEDSQVDACFARRHRSVASLSLHASPQSSVERVDSPPPLRRQQNVTSSSPTRQSRRPRSYVGHRRRTWSHLLEKKH